MDGHEFCFFFYALFPPRLMVLVIVLGTLYSPRGDL